MDVGQLRVDPVIDGSFRLRPTELYAGTSEADWSPHAGLTDADGMVTVATGGFLIRTGAHVVLVDLGVGPAATDPARPPTSSATTCCLASPS